MDQQAELAQLLAKLIKEEPQPIQPLLKLLLHIRNAKASRTYTLLTRYVLANLQSKIQSGEGLVD